MFLMLIKLTCADYMIIPRKESGDKFKIRCK